MKSKAKNNKVPKSAKTRLSDLTPKKDARGGKYLTPPAGVAKNAGPAPTPPYKPSFKSSVVRKHATL